MLRCTAGAPRLHLARAEAWPRTPPSLGSGNDREPRYRRAAGCSSVAILSGSIALAPAAPGCRGSPVRASPNRPARSPSLPNATCWWSAAARPAPRRRSRPRGSAPSCCWNARPPRRALDRRPGHLDRPDDRLDRHAGHRRLRRGHSRPAAAGRRCRPAARAGDRDAATAAWWALRPRPSTASSPGRRRSIRSGSRLVAQEMVLGSRRQPCSTPGAPADRGGRRRPRRGLREQGGPPGDPRRVAVDPPATATCSPGRRRYLADIEEVDIHHP